MNFIFTRGYSIADPSEAVQAVTENGAGEIEMRCVRSRFQYGGNPSRGATPRALACLLVTQLTFLR
jgi:hypothetical protein